MNLLFTCSKKIRWWSSTCTRRSIKTFFTFHLEVKNTAGEAINRLIVVIIQHLTASFETCQLFWRVLFEKKQKFHYNVKSLDNIKSSLVCSQVHQAVCPHLAPEKKISQCGTEHLTARTTEKNEVSSFCFQWFCPLIHKSLQIHLDFFFSAVCNWLWLQFKFSHAHSHTHARYDMI